MGPLDRWRGQAIEEMSHRGFDSRVAGPSCNATSGSALGGANATCKAVYPSIWKNGRKPWYFSAVESRYPVHAPGMPVRVAVWHRVSAPASIPLGRRCQEVSAIGLPPLLLRTVRQRLKHSAWSSGERRLLSSGIGSVSLPMFNCESERGSEGLWPECSGVGLPRPRRYTCDSREGLDNVLMRPRQGRILVDRLPNSRGMLLPQLSATVSPDLLKLGGLGKPSGVRVKRPDRER
ncbi:hypothetical protein GGR56DRAFT_402694 [Xylariaceae sp. FL0804]|nr:hypothetical protein GGR56DRAFT_402694 [Xylariaceae sp. FL0804]